MAHNTHMQKVLIEENLHRECKAAAALLGISLRAYVANALTTISNGDLADPDEARASMGLKPKRTRSNVA